MINAQELSQRILAEVQEAGFEDLHAILNTVLRPTGSADEVQDFASALAMIVKNGLGYLSLERMNPQELIRLSQPQADQLIAELDEWFRFDLAERSWALGKGDFLTDRYPVLFLTRLGISKGREALGQRGYNWWAEQTM